MVVVSPAPDAPAQTRASLSARYAELAVVHAGLRRVDGVLRGLDILISAVVLVMFAPVAGAIAIAIRVTSGKPVLYRGARVGRSGRIFTMTKFRTAGTRRRSATRALLGPGARRSDACRSHNSRSRAAGNPAR